MSKSTIHRGLKIDSMVSPDNKDWQMTEVVEVTRYQLQVMRLTTRWVNEDGEYLEVN